jgi:large subunit ribosomal protein L13
MKTANKCFQAKPSDVTRNWYVVDATDQVLGRLAVRVARVLMGKHKPIYTPHLDTGDYVVVLNAGKVRVTGRKLQQKQYMRYTRYPSGHKHISLEELLRRHPERALREAVRRMLPKNALARHMLAKLKLYNGSQHRHQAQNPQPLPI